MATNDASASRPFRVANGEVVFFDGVKVSFDLLPAVASDTVANVHKHLREALCGYNVDDYVFFFAAPGHVDTAGSLPVSAPRVLALAAGMEVPVVVDSTRFMAHLSNVHGVVAGNTTALRDFVSRGDNLCRALGVALSLLTGGDVRSTELVQAALTGEFSLDGRVFSALLPTSDRRVLQFVTRANKSSTFDGKLSLVRYVPSALVSAIATYCGLVHPALVAASCALRAGAADMYIYMRRTDSWRLSLTPSTQVN